MKNENRSPSTAYQPSGTRKVKRLSMRLLSVLISLLIVLLATPALSAAIALPAPVAGTILVDKTAAPYDTYDISDPFDGSTIGAGHRKTTVTLTVDAIPFASQVDLVLVVDVSASMNTTAITAMKSAAKLLAQNILGANAGSRISIVKYACESYAYDFGDAAWVTYNPFSAGTYFSSDLTAISAVIDALARPMGDAGGTNAEGAFLAADWLMQNQGRTNAQFIPSGKRVITFMTDGVPTYRYTSELDPTDGGSGSTSSWRELNEAMEAGSAAMTNSNGESNSIYTIGLYTDLSDYEKSVARLFLNNQLRIDDNWDWGDQFDAAHTTPDASLDFETGYYEAADTTTISAIFTAITNAITQVATGGVVTDILSSEWTLDPASFLVNGAAPAPGDVTVVGDTITWNVGAITSTAKTLSYVISGDALYYGIVDTNDSAKLEFTPVLGAASPTASPVFFPVPEAMLSAFTADDEETVAWDSAVTFDVRGNDGALNTRIDQGGGSYVPDFSAFVPVLQDPIVLTYSRPGVSGSLVLNADGTLTYTPDGSVLATGYDVSFPYYLVGVDSAFRSEPATVTIHVTPTGASSLQIEKINEGGLATDSFTFTVRIDGELYNGPATIGATPATIVDGILNLTGGQVATISGLLPGTAYSVVETEALGYSYTDAVGSEGTISLDGSLASFTNYADNGQLTIYKSVIDANGQDATDQELVFPILITGPSYPTGLATTVTSGLPLVLTGLAFGDYTVVETDDSGLYDVSIGSEGASVNLNVENKSDSIYITNTEVASPYLTVVKVAQNLTAGGDPVDGTIVDAVVGDVIRYTVTVTNPGNMTLTDAVLSDDLVTLGSAVSVDGTPTVWLDGGAGNDPYIDLGTLVEDDVVVVTYDYTITAADAIAGLRTNVATVEAVATYPMLLQYAFAVRDELMLPETELLTASDDAVVLADEIPLSGIPSISLTKSVRNKTLSGTFGDAAGGFAGDVFEYRIIAMNNGTVALSNVMVHDNRAVVGSAVTVNGVAKTWTAGTDGKAVVNIGDLAIGAIATLTYDYTSVTADVGTSLVNTAIADGTVTVTIPNPVPTKISSLGDTALALVEERIPEAGESVSKELIAGATALGVGAIGTLLLLGRRKREDEEPI